MVTFTERNRLTIWRSAVEGKRTVELPAQEATPRVDPTVPAWGTMVYFPGTKAMKKSRENKWVDGR